MRKHVHPAYFDQAPLYSIAYSCPWLMNAILALSSHHLSWLQSKNGDPAVPYYAKAVRDLRKNMSSMSPDDDSLLSTITFLGLYEELRSDNFSHHMVHFNTSSQILKARMGELQQRRDANSIFLRIHAESAMYHLSTRALFAESLPTERDWAQLQQYLSTHPPSGAAEWTESPLLGSIPHLFTLILETTRLSRSAPLNDALMEKAAGYLSEIREANLRLASFRSRIAASHDSSPDPTLALEVHCIPALYLLALEMLLLKITRPATTRADSPDIQERADSAHALFHTPPFRPVLDAMRAGPDPTFPFTESNCWPLLVIGCATTRGEHVKALKAVLLNLWEPPAVLFAEEGDGDDDDDDDDDSAMARAPVRGGRTHAAFGGRGGGSGEGDKVGRRAARSRR
ncbi:putative fungal zn binuclear cluster domain containing protein [Diplodia seriata]|uniref:Putative fungal zn binuclear cluster domain containing protein n=1 Tax=Diplodia seriata TaxID=420778 RepID=A0A0G2FMV2_9PEZI|nr:putative fungal zn binuclear cluster domain containing protein [Diplodia seriata]